MGNSTKVNMSDKLWHVVIYKNYYVKGDGWNASIAPVSDPSNTVNLFPFNFRTAQITRIEVDKMFPIITWVNAKKGYVAQEEEV